MNLVGYDAAYNAVMIVTVYSIYPEGSRTWRMMLKAANEFLPWWNKPDGPALTVIHDGEKAASSAIKEHTLPNVHSFMDCRHMANNLLANVPRKGRSYRYRRSTIAGMQNCEGQGCTDSNRSLFLCTPVAPHTLHPGGGGCEFLQCTVLGKHGAVSDDVTLRGRDVIFFLKQPKIILRCRYAPGMPRPGVSK